MVRGTRRQGLFTFINSLRREKGPPQLRYGRRPSSSVVSGLSSLRNSEMSTLSHGG